jgi:hypothetical protein
MWTGLEAIGSSGIGLEAFLAVNMGIRLMSVTFVGFEVFT